MTHTWHIRDYREGDEDRILTLRHRSSEIWTLSG